MSLTTPKGSVRIYLKIHAEDDVLRSEIKFTKRGMCSSRLWLRGIAKDKPAGSQEAAEGGEKPLRLLSPTGADANLQQSEQVLKGM